MKNDLCEKRSLWKTIFVKVGSERERERDESDSESESESVLCD